VLQSCHGPSTPDVQLRITVGTPEPLSTLDLRILCKSCSPGRRSVYHISQSSPTAFCADNAADLEGSHSLLSLCSQKVCSSVTYQIYGFLLDQSVNCAAGSAVGHYTPENYLGVHSTLQGSLWAYHCIKSTLQGILHEDAPIPIYFHLEISNCHHQCQFAVEGPSEVAGSARLAPRELMIRL
jgi:hypothetical protein